MTKSILIGIACFIMSCSTSSNTPSSKGEKIGQTVAPKNEPINWEAFAPSSTVAASAITIKDLQGPWKAYQGAFLFEGAMNTMQLTKAILLEVKDDTYRRNSSGVFEGFTIKNNIITKQTENTTEIGIINKISPTELTISWKHNNNYTRYYYKK